jgi:hypothetical protein
MKRRFLVKLESAARNGGGFVPDSFQVVTDFHGHSDQAQFRGQRRLGQEIDRHLIDLLLKFVENRIVLLDPPGQIVVAIHHRFNAAGDGVFRVTGHDDQLLLQLVEFL